MNNTEIINKLHKVYGQHNISLGNLIIRISEGISGKFVKDMSDEDFSTVLDFCITFPEWLDKIYGYDGRRFYLFDGVSDRIYIDEIDRLLYQGKRKPIKPIFEICSTLDELLELMYENE